MKTVNFDDGLVRATNQDCSYTTCSTLTEIAPSGGAAAMLGRTAVSAASANVVAIGAGAREVYQRIVDTNLSVSPTQTPQWLDAICASGSYVDATRLYELDGRVLVLPLVRRRAIPSACSIEESWPSGWEYGGLVGTAPISIDDMKWVTKDLSGNRRILSTRIWAKPTLDWLPNSEVILPPELNVCSKDIHVLNLSGGLNEVWERRFTGKARSATRKSRRLGVTVTVGNNSQQISWFDHLYRLSIDRWAAERGHSRRVRQWLAVARGEEGKLVSVLRNLGDAAQIRVAHRDGRPIAGIVVLIHGQRAVYWRGAMDKELTRGTGANELLHWGAVNHAHETECTTYDMGVSPTVSVTKFKTSLGARPHQMIQCRVEPAYLSRVERNARCAVKRLLHI